MYNLPTSIKLDSGEIYEIRNDGDYRIILKIISIFNSSELSPEEKSVSALIIFYKKFINSFDVLTSDNLDKLYEKMVEFIQINSRGGARCKYKMIDWDEDEILIVPAINNVAKTEIRALPYLHWWTFIGYYMSIGECPLSTVVSIRSKIYKHEKLEKWEKEFKRDNPNYFKFVIDSQNNNGDEILQSIWNKK